MKPAHTRARYRISIVIPAYNEGKTIKRCLDALMQQSVAPDEILVVDNNSADNTAAIAHSYREVRVIPKTDAQGITVARNAGLDAATGDILCRIDADTAVPPNWVEEIRHYFDANPQQIAALYGMSRGARFDVRAPRWVQHVVGVAVLDLGFFVPTWLMLGGHATLYGSNMLITRHTWQTVRPDVATDDSVHEDVDLSACIIAHGGRTENAHLPKVLVSSRSLCESPVKFFWRLRIWVHSSRRVQRLKKAKSTE